MCGCALLWVGCEKNHGDPFLTFAELCPSRAEDICAARLSTCCDGDAEACDQKACLDEETALCDEQRAHFADEIELEYDSERAARVAAEQRAALDVGDGPFPLGRFFEGALAEGKSCERDAQCESDDCDEATHVCAGSAEAALCPVE